MTKPFPAPWYLDDDSWVNEDGAHKSYRDLSCKEHGAFGVLVLEMDPESPSYSTKEDNAKLQATADLIVSAPVLLQRVQLLEAALREAEDNLTSNMDGSETFHLGMIIENALTKSKLLASESK